MENALLRNLVKLYCRASGNDPGTFTYAAPYCILVVGLIARQSYRNQETLFIVSDKVQNYNIVFVLKLSQTTSELLQKQEKLQKLLENMKALLNFKKLLFQ